MGFANLEIWVSVLSVLVTVLVGLVIWMVYSFKKYNDTSSLGVSPQVSIAPSTIDMVSQTPIASNNYVTIEPRTFPEPPSPTVLGSGENIGIIVSEDGSLRFPLYATTVDTRLIKYHYWIEDGRSTSTPLRLEILYDGVNCSIDRGCNEVQTGDTVTINGITGVFTVNLYNKT